MPISNETLIRQHIDAVKAYYEGCRNPFIRDDNPETLTALRSNMFSTARTLEAAGSQPYVPHDFSQIQGYADMCKAPLNAEIGIRLEFRPDEFTPHQARVIARAEACIRSLGQLHSIRARTEMHLGSCSITLTALRNDVPHQP